MYFMDPPNPASIKELMTNSIKEECKKILEKYLDERKYNKDKVEKWKNMIFQELEEFLKNKYPEYGFVISILISEPINFRSHGYNISYTDSDNSFIQSFYGDIYSEIRILFIKLYSSKGLTNDKYNDIFSDNIIMANKLISDILKNKQFNDYTTAYDIKNICQGFNNYLFEKIKINTPCFMNIGYIFKQPLKDLKYYYKIININYIPFMVSYTNESLFCLFVSFALDN